MAAENDNDNYIKSYTPIQRTFNLSKTYSIKYMTKEKMKKKIQGIKENIEDEER